MPRGSAECNATDAYLDTTALDLPGVCFVPFARKEKFALRLVVVACAPEGRWARAVNSARVGTGPRRQDTAGPALADKEL